MPFLLRDCLELVACKLPRVTWPLRHRFHNNASQIVYSNDGLFLPAVDIIHFAEISLQMYASASIRKPQSSHRNRKEMTASVGMFF